MREYSARMEHMMYTPVTLPVTNEYGYFEIRLESIGGLGANLCGKMLGELGALSLSLNSLSFSSYGSEKRGSPVKAYVRWCADDRPLRVNSPVTRPHLLGIFHEGLIGTYPVLDGVTVDTKIVLNTPLSADEAADKYHISIGELYCLDALALAMESHSRINMVMLGAIAGISGFVPLDVAETLCRDTIGKKYPALIDRKTYEAVQTLKDEKYLQKDLDRQADIFQITIPVRCPNCSGVLRRKADNRRKTAVWWKCLTPNCKTNIGKTDESLIEELTEVMNGLIAEPDRIDIPPEKDPEPSIELRRLNNEIARLLDSIQINRDTVREKIIEYASLKYAEFDSALGKAQRVKDIFKTAAPLKKFSSELLERTVDEIRMYADGRIGIVLENKQEIRHRG